MPRPDAHGIRAALGVAAAAFIVTVTAGVGAASAEARSAPPAVQPRPASPAHLATAAAPIAVLTAVIASPTTYPVVTAPATGIPLPTSTSLPSIRNRIPVPPSTVPLQTRAPSAHISPVFPALSGAGFFVALVIMASRFVMTRSRRRQRA